MQLEDWPSASSSSPHAVALRVLACARSSSSKSSGGGGGGGNVEGEEDAGECDEYEIGETVVSRSGGLSYCHHVSRRQKVSQPVHNLVIVVAVQLACLLTATHRCPFCGGGGVDRTFGTRNASDAATPEDLEPLLLAWAAQFHRWWWCCWWWCCCLGYSFRDHRIAGANERQRRAR